MAATLGLTGNGVRLHVESLEREGLIERVGSVRGASKPSVRYGLSPAGRRVFSRAQSTLLGGILDALPARPRLALLARVGRRLARAVPVGRGTFPERLNGVLDAFRSLGGDPVLERNGRITHVSMHHCPLADVVAGHPEACAFGRALVEEVTGARVEGRCVHGTRPRCHFEIESSRAPAGRT